MPQSQNKPSKVDWENNKEEIIRIYKSEGLKAVMREMSKKNFYAKYVPRLWLLTFVILSIIFPKPAEDTIPN